MQLAIISDTHLPKGNRRLPDACIARLRGADLIVHAGDLSTVEVLRDLRALGPPVAAIHGNVDSPELRGALPGSRTIEHADIRIAVLHDAGQRTGRLERLRRRFPDVDAVIFGHSHLPLHEQAPDGFQIFNPGSPTERRRAPVHTMGIARIDPGTVSFELIELG